MIISHLSTWSEDPKLVKPKQPEDQMSWGNWKLGYGYGNATAQPMGTLSTFNTPLKQRLPILNVTVEPYQAFNFGGIGSFNNQTGNRYRIEVYEA